MDWRTFKALGAFVLSSIVMFVLRPLLLPILDVGPSSDNITLRIIMFGAACIGLAVGYIYVVGRYFAKPLALMWHEGKTRRVVVISVLSFFASPVVVPIALMYYVRVTAPNYLPLIRKKF